MIRDITHNKKERKESVMTIVESDVELFAIHQAQGESQTSTTMYLKPRLIP